MSFNSEITFKAFIIKSKVLILIMPRRKQDKSDLRFLVHKLEVQDQKSFHLDQK